MANCAPSHRPSIDCRPSPVSSTVASAGTPEAEDRTKSRSSGTEEKILISLIAFDYQQTLFNEQS